MIATDYTQYAVVFTCRQLTAFMSAEMIWIYGRVHRPAHAVMVEAYRALDVLKLSKVYLMHTDQANCNHNGTTTTAAVAM